MGLEEIFQHQHAEKHKARHRQQTVSGSYGMAASAIKEATDAGERILEDGGNAIDAIIAIQLALAAVEGMNTGIGASGFIVIYGSQRNETKVINGHSQAPAAVEPDQFLTEDGEAMTLEKRSISPKAIGVPGIMKAMELAHEQYGSLPLERLTGPAIKLAEEEYRVNFLWERTIDSFHERMGEEAKKIFMPNGRALKEGDLVKQPDLAKSLKLIRDEGFKTVYEGELADAIIDTIQDHGGLMVKKDLQTYEAAIGDPFWGSYKDFEFAFPAPPNGGGFAVAQLLKILEPLDISQYGPHSWEKYHLIAEAMRLSMADQQAFIGDPDFSDIPMEGLFHPDYIEKRRNLISLKSRIEKAEPGDPWSYQDGEAKVQIQRESNETGMDTTHFTAVDRWGNIAACTSSIERIFGSGIIVPGYGFLLNNDLTDFKPEPGGGTANELGAHKQAVSSKTPTIVFHGGKPFFTLGSPGAATIVASVAQVILNVLEYKMDLGRAIAEPRIYNTPDLAVQWEDGINDEAMEKLEDLGYEVDRSYKSVTADFRIGDVQAILIDQLNGMIYGAADSPRPGAAKGVTEAPAQEITKDELSK